MDFTRANNTLNEFRDLRQQVWTVLQANPESYLSEDDLPAVKDIYPGDILMSAQPEGLFCFGTTSPEDEDEGQGFAFTVLYGAL